MALLDVTTSGLTSLAAHHRSCAADIADLHTSDAPGSAYQATTAAVRAVYAGVAADAVTLTTRLRNTADKLEAAADAYSDNDAASASRIRALIGGR
jgi:uncharacterized protein YukE